MNKLGELSIADLSQEEEAKLIEFEKELNKMHTGEAIYLMALKK